MASFSDIFEGKFTVCVAGALGLQGFPLKKPFQDCEASCSTFFGVELRCRYVALLNNRDEVSAILCSCQYPFVVC